MFCFRSGKSSLRFEGAISPPKSELKQISKSVSMAIISEYEEEEEDSEERPAVVGVINMQDEEEDGYEDEDEDNDEDYNPDPYFSSQPVYATNSMRPFDEVLRYLLQEHQQQPLDLLSTVIEYLFRKTGIAMQEGVDARVSEMLFAAKRMRVDGDDIEDVFAGPDKVAKLDEIFDDPGTKEEDSPHVSVSESTKGLQGSVSSTSESSKKQGSAVEDEETVIITPTEYLQKDMCEDPEVAVFVANNSGLYHQTDTNHDTKTDMKSETEITTLSEVEPVTNNWLAGEPGNIEIHCKGKKKGLEKGEKPQDLDPNSGNGADLGHYSWTQTLTDTALIFPVPAGTKAKSVVCEIQPRYLKIGLKGEIPLLEVKFPWNLSGVEFVHGCAIPDRLLVYNSENPSTISRIRIPLAKHH